MTFFAARRTTRWSALVPQKSFVRAKSRLGVSSPLRRAMAIAMLRDTVRGLEAVVDHVVVLWDEGADSRILPTTEALTTTGLGLNGSLEYGAQWVSRMMPEAGVLVVPGDLPALDPVELLLCLERASQVTRAYLPDAEGTGTTLLSAAPGTPLSPVYGADSAAAHSASGAQQLEVAGLDSLRADVDNMDSWERAMRLGCGPHTSVIRAGEELARRLKIDFAGRS